MRYPYYINSRINPVTASYIAKHLKFPENGPITALDYNAADGKILQILTRAHKGSTHLYGITENRYEAITARENGFEKVCQAFYKSEARISEEAFSFVFVDAVVHKTLSEEYFQTVDPFLEPDFEAKAKERSAAAAKMKEEIVIDFGDDGLTPEQIQKREEEAKKKLEESIFEQRKAFRKALKEQENRLSFYRDDVFLMANAMKRLVPGGVMVMITPKEMIDQSLTLKLANNFENIQIFRMDDDEYEGKRKFIIFATKRRNKTGQDREKGILLGETKFKSYKEFPIIDVPSEGDFIYEVPSVKNEKVNTFRIGPLMPTEVLSMMKKSPLVDSYKKRYSQTLTDDQPIAPTPLHKGHIMLLLTSGFLNGYVGTGADQHLVKGSAVKLSRDFAEMDDDGVTTVKEREYYNISVKYLDKEGKFHVLM